MQRILPRGGCARRGGAVIFASDDETSKRKRKKKRIYKNICYFYFNYFEREIFTSVPSSFISFFFPMYMITLTVYITLCRDLQCLL